MSFPSIPGPACKEQQLRDKFITANYASTGLQMILTLKLKVNTLKGKLLFHSIVRVPMKPCYLYDKKINIYSVNSFTIN